MKGLKLSIGITEPYYSEEQARNLFRYMKQMAGDMIYDLHFAHYDSKQIASGRRSNVYPNKDTEFFKMVEAMVDEGIRSTLLLNYIPHDDFGLVVDILKKKYLPRGLNGVVVADIELARKIKQEIPDLDILGSCLSYRTTVEDLKLEKDLGFVIHNPSMNIIRDVKNLKRNHELGYIQKVIPFEGCLHKCEYEEGNDQYSHRWAVAHNESFLGTSCRVRVRNNIRHFLKANWVTISRLKQLEPYIDVVKLQRGLLTNTLPNKSPELFLQKLRAFIDLYQHGNKEYNVLDYISVSYRTLLRNSYGYIPSTLFSNDFFDHIEQCDVSEDCAICNDVIKELDKLKNRNER